jgi:hypothetical protein
LLVVVLLMIERYVRIIFRFGEVKKKKQVKEAPE